MSGSVPEEIDGSQALCGGQRTILTLEKLPESMDLNNSVQLSESSSIAVVDAAPSL